MTEFSDLKGLILTSIASINGDEELIFTTNTGRKFQMYHSQDCCESVSLEETIGDLNDLLDTPILMAEERNGSRDDAANGYDVEQWTFYELRTIKGSVTLRWYGTSNGYYSTSVNFEEVKN